MTQHIVFALLEACGEDDSDESRPFQLLRHNTHSPEIPPLMSCWPERNGVLSTLMAR